MPAAARLGGRVGEIAAALTGRHARGIPLRAGLIAYVVLASACSDGDPRTRLARAEAAMEDCKARIGLPHVSTPSTVVLTDQSTAGQALTEESAGRLRMKVQCRKELDELLDARRRVTAR